MAPACSSLARASSALTATSSLSSSASSFCRALPLRLCSRAYADCKSHIVFMARQRCLRLHTPTTRLHPMSCSASRHSRRAAALEQASQSYRVVTHLHHHGFWARRSRNSQVLGVVPQVLDTDVPVSVLFHKCTNAFAQARHWSQLSQSKIFHQVFQGVLSEAWHFNDPSWISGRLYKPEALHGQIKVSASCRDSNLASILDGRMLKHAGISPSTMQESPVMI